MSGLTRFFDAGSSKFGHRIELHIGDEPELPGPLCEGLVFLFSMVDMYLKMMGNSLVLYASVAPSFRALSQVVYLLLCLSTVMRMSFVGEVINNNGSTNIIL